MTRADYDSMSLDQLTARMFEHVFRSFIEDGTILVQDRSVSEIIEDFKREVRKLIEESDRGPAEIHAALDYRGPLLERAQTEASDGNEYIAVTLYATWIEHFLNGILSLMMTRRGYSDKTIRLLLREVRTVTKATALWEVAGLRPLAEEHVSILDKAINSRNYFVHYKWVAASESDIEARHERLRETVEAMANVVEALHSVELSEIWCGRESELIAGFYRSIEEREREAGTFSDYLERGRDQK